MKNYLAVITLLYLLSQANVSAGQVIVTRQPAAGSFTLASANVVCTIYTDINDHALVLKAASLLQQELSGEIELEADSS